MMEKPDFGNIRNLIFDLGNVLIDLDPKRTREEFRRLGLKDEADFFGGRASMELMLRFERGQASPEEFRNAVISSMTGNVTPDQVDAAWNAMLLEFPEHRVELLKKLRRSYRIFLLSNSNHIHYIAYTKDFMKRYGFPMNELFDKMWFSQNIGISKPDPGVYRYVLSEGWLHPEEPLFIDDTLANVEAARKAGIQGWHLRPGVDVSELF